MTAVSFPVYVPFRYLDVSDFFARLEAMTIDRPERNYMGHSYYSLRFLFVAEC